MPRSKLFQEEKPVALSVRLPKSMKEIIEQKAIESRRSLNQEILWLLETALNSLDEGKESKEKE